MPEILMSQCGAREIFCVHRLDQGVGGVMVYAKTRAAAAALSGLIQTNAFEKRYLAVTRGCPAEPEGTLRDLLYRDAARNKSYVVKRMRKGVREASLEYRVLESTPDAALLLIKLHTGRSHQIRVQLSSRALPLLGDTKYGGLHSDCGIALWSFSLSFKHPVSGKPMTFSCPPPKRAPWEQFVYLKEGKENV